MGGYGSGRKGWHPTVESGPALDISRLLKTGWLRPDATTRGILRWTDLRTGHETASMGYEARLRETSGSVRLHSCATDRASGERRDCESHIELATSPQPFGGRRWWFVCPRTGRRARVLHLPPGAETFACRGAYGLGYRSQREAQKDRVFSRVFALRHKLGDKGSIGSVVARPKGMHWVTFGRAMERIERAEEIAIACAPSCGFVRSKL